MKKKAKKKKPVGAEFVIKMKDKDGNVITFDENSENEKDAEVMPELEEVKTDGTGMQETGKKSVKPKKKKIRLECENVMEALSSKMRPA